jgi:hypothetical protein
MNSTTLPVAKKLPGLIESKRLLTMLFGSETVCSLRKEAIPVENCAIVASYNDNEGKLQRLIVCDLAFANSAGAALSAIPAAVANRETKAGRFAENVLENLSEVMNIAVNMLNESFGGRLELSSVSQSSGLASEIVGAIKSSHKVKIDVTIPRYELGRIDLIAVEN